jgi:NTP pyrophosphatase (non-canonical NTP hydrolase)
MINEELKRWAEGGNFAQREAVLDILVERLHQDNKWGPIEHFDTRHPGEWLMILMEEAGDLSEAILKKDQDNIREEAVQVAAVALSILESDQRHRFTER